MCMILFLGPACPRCDELKQRVDLDTVPVLTVVHTDGPDGLAEADMYDVFSVPALVLDDGSHVTDLEAIVAQLTAS